MLDKNLLLRQTSDGNLTASETARAGVDYGAGDREPLSYVMKVTQATGTTPTLVAKIQESDDNSNWVDLANFENNASTPSNTINAAGVYIVSFRSSKRYRRAHLTVGGTTPNFGAVEIGPDVGGDYLRF
jgi:hypothetical protein